MTSGFAGGRDKRGRYHQPVQDCRSCRRRMLWVTLPSGKRMPLDLQTRDDDPAPDYLVIDRPRSVEHHGDRWRLGIYLRDEELRVEAGRLGLELRTSHFDTCPGNRERRRRADIDG